MGKKSGKEHKRPKNVRELGRRGVTSVTSVDEDGVCYSVQTRPRRVRIGPPQPGDDLPRVIVPRVYNREQLIRFRSALPPKLRDRGVDDAVWNATLAGMYEFFDRGEEYGMKTCFETFTTIITVNLISFFRKTNYEKAVEQLVAFVEDQNRTIYDRHFIHIVDPTLNGFIELEMILLPVVPVPRMTDINPDLDS